MDKDKLVAQITNNGKNYSQQGYLIGFFVIFILLIVFVVRPNINEYLIRQKQLEETTQLIQQYQKAILSLNALQSVLESHRDDFVMLDQAVPSGLGIYQIAIDIRDTFLDHTPSKKYSFPPYVVTNESKDKVKLTSNNLKEYVITVDMNDTYQSLQDVLGQVLNQRRIKSINSIAISKPVEASSSSKLNMKLEIKAYHL